MDTPPDVTDIKGPQPSETPSDQRVQVGNASFEDFGSVVEPLDPPILPQEMDDMIPMYLNDGDIDDAFLDWIINDNSQVVEYENLLQDPPPLPTSSVSVQSLQNSQSIQYKGSFETVPPRPLPPAHFAIASTAAEVTDLRSGKLLKFPPSETITSVFIPATIFN